MYGAAESTSKGSKQQGEKQGEQQPGDSKQMQQQFPKHNQEQQGGSRSSPMPVLSMPAASRSPVAGCHVKAAALRTPAATCCSPPPSVAMRQTAQ